MWCSDTHDVWLPKLPVSWRVAHRPLANESEHVRSRERHGRVVTSFNKGKHESTRACPCWIINITFGDEDDYLRAIAAPGIFAGSGRPGRPVGAVGELV